MTPVRSNLGAANVWLTPTRSRTEVGRSVTIVAEVQSKQSLVNPTLQAFVSGPDEGRVPLVFLSDSARPRHYVADFRCTQPGLHRITATLLVDGKVAAEGSTVLQVDPTANDDAGVDLANLARIARDTGGNLVDPARSETWPAADATALPPVERVRTFDLWGNFTLILLLCGLLGIDWFVRLYKGLVSG